MPCSAQSEVTDLNHGDETMPQASKTQDKKTSKATQKPATKKAAPRKASQSKEDRAATAATQIIPNIAEIVAQMDKSQPPS